MAKLYKLAGKGLVLLDERGKTQTVKKFITDNHPAFAGQLHKLAPCDPADAGGELTEKSLMGRLGDIERDRGEQPDRMQRGGKARAS